MIAITEAALIIDEPITTVERNCQHQEPRTEAEVARTRGVPSGHKQRLVLRGKMPPLRSASYMHLRKVRFFSKCGTPNHFKLPVFKRKLGRASFSASYVKIFCCGNSPVEALFAIKMIQDKLIMALMDSGNSFNLLSDTLQ